MANKKKPADPPSIAAGESRGDRPPQTPAPTAAKEVGGRGGLEPTRYGDWEKNGRCIDF